MRLVKIDGPGAYKKVPDSFRSHVEDYARKREMVKVIYREDGSERLLNGVRISNISENDDGKYIQIVHRAKELLIRLDTIVAVNDKMQVDFG